MTASRACVPKAQPMLPRHRPLRQPHTGTADGEQRSGRSLIDQRFGAQAARSKSLLRLDIRREAIEEQLEHLYRVLDSAPAESGAEGCLQEMRKLWRLQDAMRGSRAIRDAPCAGDDAPTLKQLPKHQRGDPEQLGLMWCDPNTSSADRRSCPFS
jgi:hypothetical protein